MPAKVEFKDTSDSAKNGILEQQKQALRASGKLLKKVVRDAAPEDTGNLKKNIATWVRVNKKTGETKLEIGVYDRARAEKKGLQYAFQAHMLEFGTSKMRPRPFLKDPVRSNVGEVRNEMSKFLPDIKPVETFVDVDEEVAEDV